MRGWKIQNKKVPPRTVCELTIICYQYYSYSCSVTLGIDGKTGGSTF